MSDVTYETTYFEEYCAAVWYLSRPIPQISETLDPESPLATTTVVSMSLVLRDVSDLNSANYGEHWTRQQVAEMFEPSEETVDMVKR